MEETNTVKVPRGEQLRTRYYRNGALVFIMTVKPESGYYFLYEVSEDKLVKLGRALSPLTLEEQFNIAERMGVHV